MNIKHIFQRVAVLAIASLLIFMSSPSALASDSFSNQAMHQSALLIAPDPDAQINVYPRPDTRKRRVGYGMSGDRVTVLEQVGSNEGLTWNRVEFEAAPHLKGWVREDFIRLRQSSDRPDSQQSNQSNQQNYRSNERYGNQQKLSKSQNSVLLILGMNEPRARCSHWLR
ncbi:hypothetical protein H6G89_07840 [Oscillatoria sp. FACHB-1407]|uniref:hypothetical protein n=1 Tax=Oscillatoria sp. FACHB-1407 TaxID=2692847 RepID=UPI001689F802|nr:hypothetical protein [Oscillatoria sp. FACHB-1407]MBD2460953.1 hypothetical protein [Oscillatoria sp. FACHB-1407]